MHSSTEKKFRHLIQRSIQVLFLSIQSVARSLTSPVTRLCVSCISLLCTVYYHPLLRRLSGLQQGPSAQCFFCVPTSKLKAEKAENNKKTIQVGQKVSKCQRHNFVLKQKRFSANSNYCRESLLEVRRQNIAGHCQETFKYKKFVDITEQCFDLLHQVNFPDNNLNFQLR